MHVKFGFPIGDDESKDGNNKVSLCRCFNSIHNPQTQHVPLPMAYDKVQRKSEPGTPQLMLSQISFYLKNKSEASKLFAPPGWGGTDLEDPFVDAGRGDDALSVSQWKTVASLTIPARYSSRTGNEGSEDELPNLSFSACIGYRSSLNSVFPLPGDAVAFACECVCVISTKGEQVYLRGHDKAITAMDVMLYQGTIFIATGDSSKRICVWKSGVDESQFLLFANVLASVQRTVKTLTFCSRPDGERQGKRDLYLIASGGDEEQSIALYNVSHGHEVALELCTTSRNTKLKVVSLVSGFVIRF